MNEYNTNIATVLTLLLGIVLTATSFLFSYSNYSPSAPPTRGPNLGLAIIVIVFLSVAGGILIAYGSSRMLEIKLPWRLRIFFYPLSPMGTTGIMITYIAYVSQAPVSLNIINYLYFSFIAGCIFAGLLTIINFIQKR